MPTRPTPSDAVRLRTLPTQVASHLIRRLVNEELTHERPPSELDISHEFGVSRVVARETLKILASLNIVEIAQGRRVGFRPRAEWDYLSPILMEGLPPDHADELLRELQEMRLVLEPELAAKAASNMTNASLTRIRAELDRMIELDNDPDNYLEADQNFHLEICRAAQNRLLERIMYSSRWLLAASRRVTNELPGSLHRATQAHQQIYAALEARDADSARAAMRAHIEATWRVWVDDAVANDREQHRPEDTPGD